MYALLQAQAEFFDALGDDGRAAKETGDNQEIRDAISEAVAEFVDIIDKDILYSMMYDGEDVIGCLR